MTTAFKAESVQNREEEILILGEITHLQTISEDLKEASLWILWKLPASGEQVILDLKGSDYHGWSYQTPPSSPSTTCCPGNPESVCDKHISKIVCFLKNKMYA
uniref:Uncharacterized protein n=1 Tax=Sphaerodactylus townsendi TaxID=933632 RepID=A0ACB8FEC1_9SAUR